MSRSYRKPYTSITGASAHNDKRWANRSVRRSVRNAIHQAVDFEEIDIPHRYECPYNDVWGWSRDGRQFYVSQYERPGKPQAEPIEVSIEEQVIRILEGRPAIQEHWNYDHETYYKTLCRK
jgi:hypothetical protein